MTHYETLGVGPNSTREDIRFAYRHLAMRHHPDRGGDTATFASISRAWDVLSDDARRAAYDRGEKEIAAPDPDMQLLATMFLQVIESGVDAKRADLTAIMRESVTRSRGQFQEQVGAAQRKIERLEHAIARVRRRDGTDADNLLTMIAHGQVANLRSSIEASIRAMDQGDRLLALLDQYETAPPEAGATHWGVPTVA